MRATCLVHFALFEGPFYMQLLLLFIFLFCYYYYCYYYYYILYSFTLTYRDYVYSELHQECNIIFLPRYNFVMVYFM
jgi:hypothetical protein